VLSRSGSIVVVTRPPRNFHLSGVSVSLLELLVRVRKLPPKALADHLPSEARPITIVAGAHDADLPPEASAIGSEYAPGPVVVTGSDIPEEISGTPLISDTALTVQLDGDAWGVDFDAIDAVNCTQVGKLFLVITLVDGRKYEIGFDEGDRTEAVRLRERVEKAIKAKGRPPA
jgi:hypothetical protein